MAEKQDLHIHTVYSDGDMTPKGIVDKWKHDEYKIIAVTDHDDIEGSRIAHEYADGMGIVVIPGIEFDTCDELSREIHMLGYNFDYDNKKLNEKLSEVKKNRAIRNDEYIKVLNELGYELTIDDLLSVNEGHFVGKPTFARVLLDKGYVKSIGEAFSEVFTKPEISCIHKETPSAKEIIDLIHEAGGYAVMAHPMEQRHKGESNEEFYPRVKVIMDKMREYGVDGIECDHPSAQPEEVIALREYAAFHKLKMTSGSDFHTDKYKRKYR